MKMKKNKSENMLVKDKCIACDGQFKTKQNGYRRFGTSRKVDGQTVAKLLQHYSLKVSCYNGFLCCSCFSQLSNMAKYERRLMSRCKKKEQPKVRTKHIIKKRKSYNILISVNSQQENSIKSLFQRNNWNCKYKVLPPIFSYLWDLEMDKENPLDGVLKVHKVADDKDIPNSDQSCNNINSGIMGMEAAVFMKSRPHRSSADRMVISKETVSACSEEKVVEEELVQLRKEESDDEQTTKEESDNDADDNEDDNEIDVPSDKEPNNMQCNNKPDNILDVEDNKLHDKNILISDTDNHTYTSKVIALEELSSTAETKDEESSKMPYDNESDNIQDDVEMLNDKDVFISEADNHTSKIIALEEFSVLAEIKHKETNKMPYDNEPDNIQDDVENKLNHKDVDFSVSADHTYIPKTIALEELPSIAEAQDNEEQEYLTGSSASKAVEKMDDCAYKRKNSAENQNPVQDCEDDKNKYRNSSASKKLTNICDDCGKALYPRKGKKTDAHCDCRVKCQFCDKHFVKSVYGNTRMETHLKAHQGFRPFKCIYCDKAYTSAHCLNNHMNRRHLPENFCHPCTICSKVFTKSGLKAHMLNMHTDRQQLFQCDLCGSCFKLKGNLCQHIRAVHAKQRNFSCDVCSATFTTSHNLRLHRVRHEADQKVVCTICGKIIQVTGYKEHMKRHTDQRTFKCEKCSKSFYNRRELVNHNKVHTGDRPFKCHLCSYTCAVKGNLTKHMRKHRTGAIIPDHMYKGYFMRSTDPEKTGRASDNGQTIPESDNKGYNCEIGSDADKLHSTENDFLLKGGLNILSSAEASINDQVPANMISLLKHDGGNFENKNKDNNQDLSRIETYSDRNSASVVGQIPIDTALNVGTGHGHAEAVGNTPERGIHLAVTNYNDHVEISSMSDPNHDIQISGLASGYGGHQGPDEGREESLYHPVAPYFN